MPQFARGARGVLITPLRDHFGLALQADPVFDEYGADLETEVRKHQTANGLAVDGRVNVALYQTLTSSPFPALFPRALMVVASIEGHGYFSLVNPDVEGRDEAGITAGVLGFTAKAGSLLAVLRGIDAGVRDAAFANQGIGTDEKTRFGTLLTLKTEAERRKAAIELFLEKNPEKGTPLRVIPRWRGFLQEVLGSSSGIAAQEKRAEDQYFKAAKKAAAENSLTSDRGVLLAFSICVQSGSLSKLAIGATERERRINAAIRRARTTPRAVKPNFESRHVGLAKGAGFPNNRFVDLDAWGFDDPDTPPAPRARMLSIGVSAAPAMGALATFETQAKASGVVQDSVLGLPAIQDRLKAVGVPLANEGSGFETRDFSNAWRAAFTEKASADARAVAVGLFAALDELPLVCLVLGGTDVGRSSRFTVCSRKGPLSLKQSSATLTWHSELLDLPLCPRMPSGLVILHMPSGIAAQKSLAHGVQSTIARINGAAPLVVGFLGSPDFPGLGGPSCAGAFFQQIASAPQRLPELVATSPEVVVQAWGKACHDSYAAREDSSGLWRRTTRIKRRDAVMSACAALTPDRRVWRAVATPAGGVYMERI